MRGKEAGLHMSTYHVVSLVDNQDHSLQVNPMCSAVLMEE